MMRAAGFATWAGTDARASSCASVRWLPDGSSRSGAVRQADCACVSSIRRILFVHIDRHMRDTVRADPGAEHAIGVEGHRHAAIGGEGNRTAIAAEFRDVLVDDLCGGFGERLLEQADA